MSSAATCARSRAVWTDRPVCLGKYWRSRPLVFSFRPLDTEAGMTSPLRWPACHDRSAYLRRQPARIVDGRMEGCYTGPFELICGQGLSRLAQEGWRRACQPSDPHYPSRGWT